MDVIPELPPNIKKLEALKSVQDLDRMAVEDARQHINDMLETMDAADVTIDVQVLSGTPYETVIRHVLTHNIDLVRGS